MEPRKIVIIDSKSQSQKIIQDSTAATLGELKAEMRNRGISYEGCTFYCGQMRAELKDDAAPIPETVMYKGQEVRDLTFMLTTPEKKIKSGIMTRAEAYARIKSMDLGELCKAKYGKNFTQCSTADLIQLIESKTTKTESKPVEKKPVEKPAKVEVKKEEPKNIEPKSDTPDKCVEALKVLANNLYDNKNIDDEAYEQCMAILNDKEFTKSEKMSKKEIDEMFNFV